MGLASLLQAALGVVAFCSALLHLGLRRVDRRSSEHFWLAVAALGMVVLAAGFAASYEAHTPSEARRAQTLSLLGPAPIVIGLLRFAALVTRRRLWPLDLGCGALALIASLGALAWPDVFFQPEILPVEVSWLGLVFVMKPLTPWALLLFLPVLATFAVVTLLLARERAPLELPGPMVASMAFWTACIVNDAAVGAGVYAGPYLAVVGFLTFNASFTVALLRRFAASLDRLETSAEELRHIVEQRTQALREKDLLLAHGARMATVGTLSSGLASEIREPLQRVIRRVDELARDFGDLPADALERALSEAQGGIERIHTIVSELLHVARRGDGAFGPVDLNRVIEGLLPIVGHEARDRARLETELGAIPPVEGDERLLGQILLNLVLNALEAIPPGQPERQRIVVRTGLCENRVRLVVEDTGPGIPERLRPVVFEPFFTTKPVGQGSGMGLAVTRQLVERHRGEIRVESSGHGTSVFIDLPAPGVANPS